jgi:hypothetical protein
MVSVSYKSTFLGLPYYKHLPITGGRHIINGLQSFSFTSSFAANSEIVSSVYEYVSSTF